MERVRLHIGSISNKLAEEKDDLESRLARYGKLVSPLELHSKPILDTKFGYITLDITKQKLNELRSAYNGVQFKGSKLSVTIARPDYQEVWKARQVQPDPKPTSDELKRLYSAPVRKVDVIDAEQRKQRRHLYTATYRYDKKGRPTVLKCRKQKLWGYEKDKGLDALVFQYTNGQWRDSHGSVVETVDYEKLKEENPQDIEEHDAALKVLENMFSGSNENDVLPVTFSDDDEPRGAHYHQAAYHNADPVEYHEGNIRGTHGSGVVNFDSDEELAEAGDYSVAETTYEEVVLDEEQTKDKNLTKLFGKGAMQESSGIFGDILDEEDVEDVQFAEPTLEAIQSSSAMIIDEENETPRIRSERGLFFPHFKSAFLSAQSQLSKVTAPSEFDLKKWDDEFWEKRGEWNREFRRRKRDVLRQLRKRNMAKGRVTA